MAPPEIRALKSWLHAQKDRISSFLRHFPDSCLMIRSCLMVKVSPTASFPEFLPAPVLYISSLLQMWEAACFSSCIILESTFCSSFFCYQNSCFLFYIPEKSCYQFSSLLTYLGSKWITLCIHEKGSQVCPRIQNLVNFMNEVEWLYNILCIKNISAESRYQLITKYITISS